MSQSFSIAFHRREFLVRSLGAAGCAAAAAAPAGGIATAWAGGTDAVRVGVVGCGGRGTGAAIQAAAADPGVRIVALGDLFGDQIESSSAMLRHALAGRFDWSRTRRHVGPDAYLGVLAAPVDLVILAAPPHALARHLAAAVDAGVHAYCEAPVAIDTAGVHVAEAAVERARAHGLSIGAGLCFRHDAATRNAIDAIRAGSLGRIEGARVEARIGLPWRRPTAGCGAAEARDRNWVSFAALSGGPFVEHHVHAIDKALWALGDDLPVTAEGRILAGRDEPDAVGDGHTGVAVRYTLADGRAIEAVCHRRSGLADGIHEDVRGTAGRASLPRQTSSTGPDRFAAAMAHLVHGIRSGRQVDEGGRLCTSTLTAVMGRMAAETGRRVAWCDVTPPRLASPIQSARA